MVRSVVFTNLAVDPRTRGTQMCMDELTKNDRSKRKNVFGRKMFLSLFCVLFPVQYGPRAKWLLCQKPDVDSPSPCFMFHLFHRAPNLCASLCAFEHIHRQTHANKHKHMPKPTQFEHRLVNYRNSFLRIRRMSAAIFGRRMASAKGNTT